MTESLAHPGLLGKLRSEFAILKGRNIFEKLSALIDQAVSNGLEFDLSEDAVVETVRVWFDEYFRPLLIPKVVDDKIWEMAEELIRGLIKDS